MTETAPLEAPMDSAIQPDDLPVTLAAWRHACKLQAFGLTIGDVEDDWSAAIREDADRGHRCPCCLEPSGHPEGCPFHPANLEAAAARAALVKSTDGTGEDIAQFAALKRRKVQV